MRTRLPIPVILPRLAFAALLILFAPLILAKAQAQEFLLLKDVPISDEYVLRAWDTSDGLPSNHISSIAQTPDGYLWVATWLSGLARFDGVHFTSIPRESTQSAGVESVYSAKDGTLWIGLELGGVSRLKNGRFEIVNPVSPRSSLALATSCFAEDSKGAIWFANVLPYRIVGIEPGKAPSKLDLPSNLGPNPSVYADQAGEIWFAMQGGCGKVEGDRVRVADSGGLEVKIAPAKGGGVWEMRGRYLIRRYDTEKNEVVAAYDWMETREANVSVLYEDREGNLWLGTQSNGLFRFRDGRIVKVPTSQSSILSITEDREGNLWVGTEGGLNRLRHSGFALRNTKNGLPHGSAISLCEDNEGGLWVVGRRGAPIRSLDGINSAFATPRGWDGPAVMSMWSDPSGGIWLGALGGLKRWSNGAFSDGGLNEQITAGLMDRKGDLWMATIKGPVIRQHQGHYESLPTGDGMIQARALAEDGAGRIWVGTEEGLLFYGQGDHFTRVPLPYSKSGEAIRFIADDGRGTLWIGSLSGSLYWWNNGKAGRVSPSSMLPVSELRSLLIEPDGDFWFGTGRGLIRVARTEMEEVLKGRQAPLRSVSYGRNDGLSALEFAVGFRNAATRTRDGHLWFATYSGALEITPEKLKAAVPPVPVKIESLACGGQALPFGPTQITLPPHPAAVQIQYTLPLLSAPEQVHFQYRLVGLSDDWIYADGQRSAVFARLTPGNYRFEVSAAEASGHWLPPAVIEFRVSAAWWETRGFYLLTGLAGALGLGWVVRLIVKRRMYARMRKMEQEHALERERIRIARDIHDQLGSHLTQIAIASKLARIEPPEAAASHIEEIAKVARSTADAVDEIVWAVNPRNDTLASLLEYMGQQALDFLEAADIACELEMPGEIPSIPLTAHMRHHLFLAVKEALNNIVKHSQAAGVFFKAELLPGTLRISILDNGKGFQFGGERVGSDGLRNMRERLAELGGECRVESSPENGTRVIFELPLAGC